MDARRKGKSNEPSPNVVASVIPKTPLVKVRGSGVKIPKVAKIRNWPEIFNSLKNILLVNQ